MRKIISIALVVIMMLSVVSCGSSSETNTGTVTVESAEKEEPNEPEKKAEPTDEPDEEASDFWSDIISDPEEKEDTSDITIEETVLLEESGVRITAKSFEQDSIFGPSVKLLVENESDKNLSVQTRSSSVNGYMVDIIFSADVAAGKKSNEDMTFMDSTLELCGIDNIADIEFSFHIYDSDTWDTYLDSEPVTIKTSAFEGYQYSYDDSGTPAYEDEGLIIKVKDLKEDEILGPELVIYIENKSSKNLVIQADNVSVNGFMVSPIFSCSVSAGKHAVDNVTFMESDLEDNDIDKITEIELSFHVFNDDKWSESFNTDPIKLTF
jgi:hypothetical protein